MSTRSTAQQALIRRLRSALAAMQVAGAHPVLYVREKDCTRRQLTRRRQAFAAYFSACRKTQAVLREGADLRAAA
jgi:hypothetical protein